MTVGLSWSPPLVAGCLKTLDDSFTGACNLRFRDQGVSTVNYRQRRQFTVTQVPYDRANVYVPYRQNVSVLTMLSLNDCPLVRTSFTGQSTEAELH